MANNLDDNEQLSEKELEKQRSDYNNAKNVRNAADVAMGSGFAPAQAVGAGIKVADKATGGKASELVGKTVTTANRLNPVGGKSIQKASNALSESGASDLIGTVAQKKAGSGALESQDKLPGGVNHSGGENRNSLPSYDGRGNDRFVNQEQIDARKAETPYNNLNRSSDNSEEKSNSDSSDGKEKDDGKSKDNGDKSKDKEEDDNKVGGKTFLSGITFVAKVILFLFTPVILGIIFIILLVTLISTMFGEYEDALGISQTTGEPTGNYYLNNKTQSQDDFYNRVNNIKSVYNLTGRTLVPIRITSVYHVLNLNGADLKYEDMTDAVIREIADSMFSGSTYNEEVFKKNLKDKIIPKYIKNASEKKRERIADDVIDYINRYYELIGEDLPEEEMCAAFGVCNYNIQGFYIPDKGSYRQKIDVSDLYVRLMQCGVGNGHNYGGTFGQPLDGESLVPFEKYILGVAYTGIREDAPKEAIKAYMVAARSFILARHVDLEGWRTLKKESDGKWVIQVASCTQDHVYCDPEAGCSGSDLQWGQIHSGVEHAGNFKKEPMAASSPFRSLATQTQGEVLVNEKNYIIYTKYNETDINEFIKLANSGLDYKQILLQVYNQGNRNYKAKDIYQASCEMDTNCGVSTGDFASWKQYRGPWINVGVGDSGHTIRQIGCLATSVSILIAKSGVKTNVTGEFNPGTFVEYMNKHGGFSSGGNLQWYAVSNVAPSFQYQNKVSLSGMSQDEKFQTIKNIVSQPKTYAVCEVKGNTGQHWVAIDSVSGNTINMMDPGSTATSMWSEYNPQNTSAIVYFKVI